ncbi:MAG: hypothetical protein WD059_08750 [Balneolaceae bacterium]
MKIILQSVFLCSLFLSLIFLTSSCYNNPADTENDESSYSHLQNPGISANDFMSSENFSKVVIEIDYMPGYAPNERALDSLQAFLEQRLNKTSITILEPSEISAAGQNTYTANEIRNLEQQHRNQFTEDETLAAYMIIVDGRFEQNNVLGIAYYNTSNAFFGVAYEDATSGFGAPSRYRTEAISFRHEFGHLLGLVGIPNSGTDMQRDHKDAEHGSHCNDNSCLMYWAMERPDLIEQFLVGEEIPGLDANCINDLQANGGK